MVDKAAGKSCRQLLNIVLANATWGRVVSSGSEDSSEKNRLSSKSSWHIESTSPSVQRPSPHLRSYTEFVEAKIPFGVSQTRKSVKKARDDLLKKFAEKGQPGERFYTFLGEFTKKLKLPEGVVGSKEAKDAGLMGSEHFILPSFLNFIRKLKESKRSFSLVFRTFGKDLEEVAKEFNAFCCGVHPLHRGFKLDGSDQQPDMRIHLENNPKAMSTKDPTPDDTKDFQKDGEDTLHPRPAFGSIDRSGEKVALYIGTLEQRKSVSEEPRDFCEIRKDRPSHIISGRSRIYEYLKERTSKPCTLALRDCFIHWREYKQVGEAGKLFILDSINPTRRHEVFFDDNIRYSETKIVDIRDFRDLSVPISVARAINKFLVRAEPLESITNKDYFWEKLKLCEESARRTRRTRTLMRNTLVRCKTAVKVFRAIRNTPMSPTKYVPWRKLPAVQALSSVETFDDDSENIETMRRMK
eukprot:jgi/Bigna1/145814/aug1.104_g20522